MPTQLTATFDLSGVDPSDREEFSAALTALLRAADRQSGSVRGGYRVETGNDEREFGVGIYRVLPRND